MSLGTSNRDGGKTSESGHLRALAKAFSGDVLTGLSLSQRAAGANMSVDVSVGDAFVRRSDGSYAHPVFNDAVYNQVIAAADGSNPRRDIVVIYVDYGQSPSTAVSNNTNGVVKIMVVAGTPAGSPVDPTDSAIQSAVGAGNPFTKLGRVRVPAGQTSITNSLIDDIRKLTQPVPQGGWVSDFIYTWVYASASTFTIAGVDARAQFPVGTKLRLVQGGTVKYFRVTAAAFSTNTTVTVDGRSTYTLSNALIENPAYSYTINPSGYPFPGTLRGNIDWGTLANNIKGAKNTSAVGFTNGVNQNLAGQGASISFTVSEACVAFVTVHVAAISTTDFEFHPLVFINGVTYTTGVEVPPASVGNDNGRAVLRSVTAAVPLVAGANTISAGAFVSSATGPSIANEAASVHAIVLGDVTA